MKTLLITQKTTLDLHGCDSDCLEKTYVDYFVKKGFQVIPLPNETSMVLPNVKSVDCIVLSGGGDAVIGDNRRNLTERLVLEEATKRDIPILGICRGLQFINYYLGGSLSKTPNLHVRKISDEKVPGHDVMIIEEPVPIRKSTGAVSSYHNDCVMTSDLASGLKTFAISDDGVVEGFYHPKKKIIAVQWHPERYDSGWVDDGIIKYISTTDF